MENLEKDIKKAIEIVKNGYNSFIDYGEMTEYSRIYQNTTEDIKSYMPFLDGNYKNALLPTASGDHQLEAILNGINHITCFDLNRLARYFAELKFCAIKCLTREEFIRFMYDDMLNQDIFNYFKNSLDDDISTFWEELYNNCFINDTKHNLFRCLFIDSKECHIRGTAFSRYCAKKFVSYLDKENYKLVQDGLRDAKIEYIEIDLLALHQSLKQKYDLINLTNIYEYVNNGIFNNMASVFASSVKKLIPFLNNNGKILISYLYKCNLEDVEQYKDKSIIYAKLLRIFNSTIFSSGYDSFAQNNNQKTIMDKLYAFRNIQLLRYMKDLNIAFHEVNGTSLGCGSGDKDMVLIYKKNNK